MEVDLCVSVSMVLCHFLYSFNFSRPRNHIESLDTSEKRAVIMVQMSELVDEWSLEEMPSKFADNIVKMSFHDRGSFPYLSLNSVSIHPGYRFIIQV